MMLKYTACPQSPLGVLKNCGAQTNWASHMRFVHRGFCRASYKRCTDCFHTFIAHTRSATSPAIMDAASC
jgi:hypothetical protein